MNISLSMKIKLASDPLYNSYIDHELLLVNMAIICKPEKQTG